MARGVDVGKGRALESDSIAAGYRASAAVWGQGDSTGRGGEAGGDAAWSTTVQQKLPTAFVPRRKACQQAHAAPPSPLPHRWPRRLTASPAPVPKTRGRRGTINEFITLTLPSPSTQDSLTRAASPAPRPPPTRSPHCLIMSSRTSSSSIMHRTTSRCMPGRLSWGAGGRGVGEGKR